MYEVTLEGGISYGIHETPTDLRDWNSLKSVSEKKQWQVIELPEVVAKFLFDMASKYREDADNVRVQEVAGDREAIELQMRQVETQLELGLDLTPIPEEAKKSLNSCPSNRK